jgi:hypothetical protein
MDPDLLRYLNDHLAGAAGAVDLIRSLAKTAEDSEDHRFFTELEAKVEKDRALLDKMIAVLGHDGSAILQAAGHLTAKASRLKLRWEGLEPGELGRFEAMEMLALGIQGKRLLWRMAAELVRWIPEWSGIDFRGLEQEAIAQRDTVEALRLRAGRAALIDPERRARTVPAG